MSTYQYENSDPERFQLFCQALLLPEYPGLQCYPVAQPDGGRDAAGHRDPSGKPILQVKFKRAGDQIDDAAAWVVEALEKELPKVRELHTRGATAYVIATNARGTAHLDVGSIDRVQAWLDESLPIPGVCMWRNDLDRRLDNSFALKWRYPELLNGTDGIRLALETGLSNEKSRRSIAISGFLTKQMNRDSEVKFKQVDLENDLLSLFVDVPATITRRARGRVSEREHMMFASLVRDAAFSDTDSADHPDESEIEYAYHERLGYIRVRNWTPYGADQIGTATMLLSDECQRYFPYLVLEGAPGQGKSTLAQYVCQVHRARYLNVSDVLDRLPARHSRTMMRLPIKVDLRDLAVWLTGSDPFTHEESSEARSNPSLESFLARLIEYESGGIDFKPVDVHEVLFATPTLLFLDGLDEVADVGLRKQIVQEVMDGLDRLDRHNQIQTIVTSRPAAFANSPGFPSSKFAYFELDTVPRKLALDYGEKWIEARGLEEGEADDVRRILRDKLALPHIQDLARNPMQLAILLALIHALGQSLPDERTELYSSYMDKFLTREADKTSKVRQHRTLLVTLHEYIAWVLQNQAEKSVGTAGSLSPKRLRSLIEEYLIEHEHPREILEDLFTGVLERVYVLVQRIDGLYEFEVQPLREYFCASFLYKTAPSPLRGQELRGTRDDRFDALIRNPYWTNVTRFYAGHYTSGELGNLVLLLKEFIEDPKFSVAARPRELGYMLLSDWVFKASPRATRNLAELVFDDLGLKLATGGFDTWQSTPAALPPDCGRPQLEAAIVSRIDIAPERQSSLELTRLLRANGGANYSDHFLDRTLAADGELRTRWIELGLTSQSLAGLPADRITSVISTDGAGPTEVFRRACQFASRDPESGSSSELVVTSFLRGCLDGEPLPTGIPKAGWPGRLWSFLRPNIDSFEPLGMRNPTRLSRPSGAGIDAATSVHPHLGSFIGAVEKQVDDLIGGRVSVFAFWRQVLESSRANFGQSWSGYASAARLAGLVDGSERGSGASRLFDDSLPLLDRSRYARIRSDSEKWWASALEESSVDYERMFWFMLLILWGKPRSLRSLSPEMARVADGLTDDQFGKVYDGISSTASWSRSHTRRPTMTATRGLPSSRRLRACMEQVGLLPYTTPRRQRHKTSQPDVVLDDREHLAYLTSVIEDPATPEKRVIECIAELYQHGWTEYVHATFSWQRSRGRQRLGADVAKKMLIAPLDYPHELVAEAADSVREEPLPALIDTVKREDWKFE